MFPAMAALHPPRVRGRGGGRRNEEEEEEEEEEMYS